MAGADWDEEVVHQGDNVARHRADAGRMLANGHAYRCFCTAAELDERRRAAEALGGAFQYDRRCDRLDATDVQQRIAAGAASVVRFRVPEGHDELDRPRARRDQLFPTRTSRTSWSSRTDGTPIYNGRRQRRCHCASPGDARRRPYFHTPKQVMLYRALGAELPQFRTCR